MSKKKSRTPTKKSTAKRPHERWSVQAPTAIDRLLFYTTNRLGAPTCALILVGWTHLLHARSRLSLTVEEDRRYERILAWARQLATLAQAEDTAGYKAFLESSESDWVEKQAPLIVKKGTVLARCTVSCVGHVLALPIGADEVGIETTHSGKIAMDMLVTLCALASLATDQPLGDLDCGEGEEADVWYSLCADLLLSRAAESRDVARMRAAHANAKAA